MTSRQLLVVGAIAMLACALAAVVGFRSLTLQLTGGAASRDDLLLAAGRLLSELNVGQDLLTDAMAGTTQPDANAWLGHGRRTRQTVRELRQIAATADREGQVSTLQHAVGGYSGTLGQLSTPPPGNPEPLSAEDAAAFIRSAAQMRAAALVLFRMLQTETHQESGLAGETARYFSIAVIALCSLGMLVGLALHHRITVLTVAPLERIAEFLDEVQGGDLRRRLPLQEDPLMAALANQCNAVAEQLQQLVGASQIRVNAERRLAEAAFESFSAATLAMNPDGEVLLANRAAMDLLVGDRASELPRLLADAARSGEDTIQWQGTPYSLQILDPPGTRAFPGLLLSLAPDDGTQQTERV